MLLHHFPLSPAVPATRHSEEPATKNPRGTTAPRRFHHITAPVDREISVTAVEIQAGYGFFVALLLRMGGIY
jgi:hypothetical protein